jgi:hypothetical protein
MTGYRAFVSIMYEWTGILEDEHGYVEGVAQTESRERLELPGLTALKAPQRALPQPFSIPLSLSLSLSTTSHPPFPSIWPSLLPLSIHYPLLSTPPFVELLPSPHLPPSPVGRPACTPTRNPASRPKQARWLIARVVSSFWLSAL